MQIHLHLGVNGSFSGVGPRLLSCSFPLTALARFFLFLFFLSLPRSIRVSVRFVHSHATPALLFVVVVLLCCLLLSFLVCKLVDCFISIFLCPVFFFCVCVCFFVFIFFFLPHPHSYLFFVIVFTSALHFERLLIPLSDFLCCLSFPPLLFFFFPPPDCFRYSTT